MDSQELWYPSKVEAQAFNTISIGARMSFKTFKVQ